MNLFSSSQIRGWLEEARAVVKLAVPLALTHLSYMIIMLTDVVMIGWIGTDALAAGSLARDFYWVLAAFAIGVLTGATPIMAQHLGARRYRHVMPAVTHAAWLAVLLAIPISIAAWWSGPILGFLGQEWQIANHGQSYLRFLLWGLLPSLWFAVLTEFLAVHTRPMAVYVVSTDGIVLNAFLDYTFMFGNFGAPEMGLEGAGVSSLVVNWFMFFVLLGCILHDRQFRCYGKLGHLWPGNWSVMAEILRIGSPIAITEIAEMGLFFVTTLMMGLIGIDALAAHAVTAQCYALVFMIPVGLAQAGAVRVGHTVGARDAIGLAQSGWTTTMLAGVSTLLPAILFWTSGQWVAGLILDPEVLSNRIAIDLAVLLLSIAAIFMVVDALQITLRGVLQGLKDTKMPMVIALSMSWGIGLPAAVFMGFFLNFGGPGIWAGMAVAMVGSAYLLIRRFRRQTSHFVAQLSVSE